MSLYNPNLPPRSDDCLTGTDFMNSVLHLPLSEVNNAFVSEVVKGNVPIWWRNFAPVTIVNGNNRLTMYVSPDVISIGSDGDYCRIPMNGTIAKIIADACNCMLPTKKIADLIWEQADLKIPPIFETPDNTMITPQVFIDHNQKINSQIANQTFTLLSGHKKDVIIHPALLNHKNNICIYGWFTLKGIPIQSPPNFTSHSIDYYDYSHSGRLINRICMLNDVETDIYELLANSTYSDLVSEEGAYDAKTIYSNKR